MFGSEILDVAIGMVMTFLLLSLVCSSIKEAFETVLNHRSKDLELGIREMLGDIQRKGIVPALYNHPLIDGLFKGVYTAGKTRNLPSYIPSRTFALALIDLLAESTKHSAAGTSTISNAPDMEAIKAAVAALPFNSRLRGALMPILAVAKDDTVQFKFELERWYDGTMDRVSGWYKRRTQIMLAGIGMSLAIAMNVDSVSLARYLNTSQTARQVLITNVQQYQQGHPPLEGPQLSELRDPMGWLQRQGGLPLGWVATPLPGQTQADFTHDWRRLPDSLSSWLFKIAGLLFTGFAVTLGAPFWFDLLNRFMVVRSTVKPDEKSPIEHSKA